MKHQLSNERGLQSVVTPAQPQRAKPMPAPSSIDLSGGLKSALLLCCAIATSALAAELKKPGPSPSDALFDPSRVIQIEIRLDPKDWLALRVSHPVLDESGRISLTKKGYDYYRGDVVIDGQVLKSVGVRKKGSWGSTASNRPGLKIKFDEYLEDQEYRELDMLTLNNCLSDPTKSQQFLVYSFMSKAGGPVPRSNLARVVVNGEDLGVYANVESIRKPFLKRHFPNANGDLYENFVIADFSTNWVHGFVHKQGKDDGLVHVKKLVNVLDRPGPASLKDIGELVDLDAFITFWAAEVLIGCFDGYAAYMNNYYVYRDPASRQFSFIPWGRDTAFSDPGFLPDTAPKSFKATGNLCRRLWELPEIRDRYRREMRRLLAEVWDEKSMLSDFQRLRNLCKDDRPQNSAHVKERMETIVRFIEGRRKEVQAELDAPAQDWPFPPRIPPTQSPGAGKPSMMVQGTFTAVIGENIDWPTNTLEFWKEGSATLQYTVDAKPHAPFTQLGARVMLKVGEQEWTNVRIVAQDASGGLRWNLGFRIDPYRMAHGTTLNLGEWAVSSVLIQGVPNSPRAQWRLVHRHPGTLELTQVSTNLGGTISGKFKIHTTAFEEEKKP